MKVIELLNKIANGEEVPEKFVYNGDLYYLQCDKCYRCDELNQIFEDGFIFEQLNDEVEIIEEPKEHKIPEKLENEKEFYAYTRYEENKDEIDKVLYILKALNLAEEKIDNLNNKINEILDYLEEIE